MSGAERCLLRTAATYLAVERERLLEIRYIRVAGTVGVLAPIADGHYKHRSLGTHDCLAYTATWNESPHQ